MSGRAVFVTRPAHQAGALMAALQAKGYRAVLAPALELRFIEGADLALDGVAAIAVTSANGVAGLVRRTARRDAALFGVGAATAEAARAAGFTRVDAADGDGAALAEWIATRLPQGARVAYPCAAEPAFDLAAALAPAGIGVDQVAVYEMAQAASLPVQALALLDAGEATAALLMSARSAAAFGALIAAAGRGPMPAQVTAICLSDQVADAAAAAGFSAWHVAARPTTAALLAALEDWAAASAGGASADR